MCADITKQIFSWTQESVHVVSTSLDKLPNAFGVSLRQIHPLASLIMAAINETVLFCCRADHHTVHAEFQKAGASHMGEDAGGGNITPKYSSSPHVVFECLNNAK